MSTRPDRLRAIDAAVEAVRPSVLFWVVSGRDFARSIAWARREKNPVHEQLQGAAKKICAGQ